MEGMFAFFLESALIGALIWGEKRMGPRTHFLVAVGCRDRKLGVGGVHLDYKLIHAAPRRLHDGAGRDSAPGGHRSVSAESLGAGDIRAQSGCGAGHRGLRCRGAGCILYLGK